MIQYTPVAGHIRVYDEGSYEDRDPYTFIVTVQWLSEDKVFLSGGRGHMTRKIWKDILRKLSSMGVVQCEYEQGGKMVVRDATTDKYSIIKQVMEEAKYGGGHA